MLTVLSTAPIAIPELIFIAIAMILALDVAIEYPNPPALILWGLSFILLLGNYVFAVELEYFYLSLIATVLIITMGLAVRSAGGRL